MPSSSAERSVATRRSKASRVSRHSLWTPDGGASRTSSLASLSNVSLDSRSNGSSSQYSSPSKPSLISRTHYAAPARKKSLFKSVRKSLSSVASFGGRCSSSSKPTIRFSKLDSPQLETLSFPTSASTDISGADSVCNGRCDHHDELSQSEAPAQQHSIPLHTKALIAVLTAFFYARLPSLSSLDQVANIDTFTHTLGLPLSAVICLRLALAAIMLGNATTVFLYGDWYADTDYFPGSHLRVARRIPFKGALVKDGSLFGGLKCISTFTLWCWIVEGTAFLMAGMIPLFYHLPDAAPISPWVFRIALVLWEVGASVSILVSAVVKYALWPMAMEHGENVKLLKSPGALLQHNLNSIAALLEVGLLGGLPVRLGDFALPPLYGIAYLLYSYAMQNQWTSKENGPQFFYPFFDPTLGATTSLLLVALLAILSLSFGIFVGAQHLLHQAEQYIAMVPVASIVLLSMMVCRVKD